MGATYAVSAAPHLTGETATVVLVILLASFDETIANLGLPPELFLEGIVALMAGVFGTVFLVLNRVESRDGMNEIEDLSGA